MKTIYTFTVLAVLAANTTAVNLQTHGHAYAHNHNKQEQMKQLKAADTDSELPVNTEISTFNEVVVGDKPIAGETKV